MTTTSSRIGVNNEAKNPADGEVLPPCNQQQTPSGGDEETSPTEPERDRLRNPKLSVIIATVNRLDYAAATVRQVLAQNFKDFELCIIDQSEKPELAACVHSDPRIRYFRLLERGLPNARNEGIAASRGEIILFLDDDVLLPTAHVLTEHLACYSDLSVGGVCGRIVDRVRTPNTSRPGNMVTLGGRTKENFLGKNQRPVRSVNGANMSFRAFVFRQLGGFDRKYIGTAHLEESDMSARVRKAGWTLLFAPEAEITHLAAGSGGVRVGDDENKEWYRFRNTAYYVTKHRGILGLLPFAVTFGLIAMVRAWRWRRGAALYALAWAAWEGVLAAGLGADEAIPYERYHHSRRQTQLQQ
jgi:GT2 family glycosyltransferase